MQKERKLMKYEVIHLNQIFPELNQDGCDPTVTVYRPDNMIEMGRKDEKRPCLVVCPGGGYCYCSQREAEPIALQFLPEGFHVFVLDYSVAPCRYPTQLIQVAATMELIYKNAEQWNCDVSRIAIIGFSAGGHLAAHYSTSFDCPQVRRVFPQSKGVQASILCYPVITADPDWAHNGSFDALLGTQGRTQEEIEKYSCNNLVTAHTPPAFLWHTAEDDCVPCMNSLLYAQALAANKVPYEMHIYPYGGHGLSTCDYRTNDNLQPSHHYDNAWLASAKRWLRLMFKTNGESNAF